MVYGHYIEDTVGSKRFFVEGCSCCRMSSAGQHEGDCPMRDIKISDIPATYQPEEKVEHTSCSK